MSSRSFSSSRVAFAPPVATVRQPAPAFETEALVNGEFKKVSLNDYKGKYLVLFFYPLDFTFVCPTEIIAFSDRVEEFRKLGAEVVGCSIDSKFSHFAWVNTPREKGGLGEMKIPLLADVTKKIAKDYGVLFEEEGIAFRGTFIIDPKQNVRVVQINDLPIGRNVDEVLRLVEAVQFTDTNGDQVCPIGWKKGSKTITANLKDSKDFFSKTYGSSAGTKRAAGDGGDAKTAKKSKVDA
ncbi:Peroxiredoxin-2 [Quaeritorhiza haematococci]|nr:Peroxiredoxin-2 [Quaeritorhiza haematococci]